MEVMELAHKKMAFARSRDRYLHPHREAMKLRLLWTYNKPPSKNRDMIEVRSVHKEVLKCIQNDEELDKVHRLITKGLLLDPKFHLLHAVRGDLYMREENWTQAIKNYNNAAVTARLDSKLTDAQAKHRYNRQLAEAYVKRANWYCDNDSPLRAISDFEQVLMLNVRGMSVVDVQNKLLGILRRLNKYEAFRYHWTRFMAKANPLRASNLLTLHAEYKIHLREMSAARLILFEAIDLNKKNTEAKRLLQVVFNTGHTLAAYSVIWCLHGCYDKALLTIEKGRDCDPYNPGFTLLKTIVLRLSGRLAEAAAWLQSVDKGFYKLLEPSRDKYGSVMGRLTMKEARDQLIKQWYLIRYDMAMRYMLIDRHDKASCIIHRSNLTKYCTEPYILLGDSYLKHEMTDLALDTYLRCRERRRELQLPPSRKSIDLTERIIDILNDKAKMAVHERRSQDAIEITDKIIKILEEDGIELSQLGHHRGRALLQKARALFQISVKKKTVDKQCCKLAAEGLTFIREDNADLYQSLYADMGTEDIVDRFGPKKKLPQSLKLLMQYS